jgi:hypothetical protein
VVEIVFHWIAADIAVCIPRYITEDYGIEFVNKYVEWAQNGSGNTNSRVGENSSREYKVDEFLG